MGNKNLKKLKLRVNGMHCASCEVLIERKFSNIEGVKKARVSHASGRAIVYYKAREPSINELNESIHGHGYTVSSLKEGARHESAEPSKKSAAKSKHYEFKKDHVEIGAAFLIVLGLYLIFKQFDILPNIGVSENMTYGLVFIIGIIAAFSTCLAVTGGLLLAVATKYNQQHHNLSGHQKFKPHIYFNIGRIASYTILGGFVGLLGSAFTLSASTTGYLTVAVSIVMVLLGLQMLNIFPWLRYFQPKMPKFIVHKIYNTSSDKNRKAAPFLFGASTFFLPCGFTQALQLYVLSTGSFMTGALTMLFFSLGTLPALVSLGAVSSFAKGAAHRYIVKTSAVAVILLGIFSISNGFALAGNPLESGFFSKNTVQNTIQGAGTDYIKTAGEADGKQIIEMKVMGRDYYPSQFTVAEGVPVEWRIDGRAAQGCAQVISVPQLGITEVLPRDKVKTITFTPEKTGAIRFSCSMGMAGPGVFNVV